MGSSSVVALRPTRKMLFSIQPIEATIWISKYIELRCGIQAYHDIRSQHPGVLGSLPLLLRLASSDSMCRSQGRPRVAFL